MRTNRTRTAASIAGVAACLVATCLGALPGGSAAHAGEFAGADALRGLRGTFASPAPESWYGGYGTREFTFADGQWSLSFVHALDPGMAKKTFRFRTDGPYAIGRPSPAVNGAFEATFGERRKLVTLLTDDPGLIKAFGFADCGLTLNVEVDISQKGCANWKPVAVCGEDHDLLAADKAGLYFGVRPRDNDMCTPDKRPTALLPPVIRQ